MPTQTTQEIPNDIPAEEAVLGSLMIDPEALLKIAFLRPDDFYRERHRMIYEGIKALESRQEPADFQTLTSELERTNRLAEIGGASYLMNLVNASPTAVHIQHYAKRVEKCAVYRRVIRAAAQITREAFSQPDDPNAMLANAEAMIYEVRKQQQSGNLLTPGDRASAAYDRYDQRSKGTREGIPYGLVAFDKWTQGAEPGQLIVIAGRPAMGKTAILQNIAENMAEAGRKVLFASAEMPESQITDRSVSGRTGITIHRLQEGSYSTETMQEITDALSQIAKEPLYLYDDADMTTGGIRAAAVEMRSRYGLDAICIDYLQILHDKTRGNEVERVTGISRALKAMARALQVPVITASQLNRGVEGRDDKTPKLSDLRDSGSIEQDADLVAMLFRPGYYSKDARDKSAQLIIAKQRNGPSGIVANLLFDQTTLRFVDATQREEYAYAAS